METGNKTFKMNTKKRKDWHKISGQGLLFTKFLIVLFSLALFATLTFNFIMFPYSAFLVGLEITLCTALAFILIRMNTFKPIDDYNPSMLNIDNDQLKLLLKNHYCPIKVRKILFKS